MRGAVDRPRRVLPIVLLVSVLAAYAGLLVLYAISGGTRGIGEDADAPDGGVKVAITLGEIDAHTNRLTVDVELVAADVALASDSGLVLREPLTVVIAPSAGSRQFEIPAGQIPPLTRLDVQLDGDIRTWPLDRYTSDLFVGVYDGSPEDDETLPVALTVRGVAEGWRTVVTEAAGVDAELAGALGFEVVRLEARRSGSTLAFALILLIILVALPVVALTVAVNTRWRSRRAVQPTFMSWLAAMLFATVPLRNFLPGSPPPGSWVDAVIVLWVIVGLVAALAIYAVAWYRQSAPADGATQR